MLVAPPRPVSRPVAALAVGLATALTLALGPVALAPLGILPDAVAADPAGVPPLPGRVAATAHAVSVASGQDGFPLRDDPAVLRLLARYRGSASGAAWLRDGIAAREEWRALVDGALAEAGLPAALAAVPLVESRYTNWGDPAAPVVSSAAPGAIPGRGLWMFIPSTARAYGLRVDEAVDERLEPARETAAAVALLTDLHDRYGDWDLALAGYNQGEVAVDAAIATGGTRDALRLAEAGLLNGYVAQVHAAALVLADPTLLD